jgi:hypothetical protein
VIAQLEILANDLLFASVVPRFYLVRFELPAFPTYSRHKLLGFGVIGLLNHASKHYPMLENPEIPLPFRIQTVSLKVLDLEFKVLDEII